MEIKFLAFDIDETLLENEVQQNGFYRKWTGLRFEHPPLLCYNTGRLLDDTRQLIHSRMLPEPDFIISGVGTNIYDFRNKQTLKEFSQILEEGWDRKKVQEVIASLEYPVTPQPGHFQNDYKSSWFFDQASEEEIHRIEHMLARAGLEVSVVYSSARHLDVLPKWADKGSALEWLLHYLGIPAESCIVAGDSGNDSAMFRIEGIKGIVVGNTQPELYQATKSLPVYFSERPRYHAVLEGLRHYELQFEEMPQAGDSGPAPETLPYLNLFELDEIKGIDRNQLDLIQEGYRQAIEVVRKNITPMGFSACPMAENDILGTDENYNSVWARDGSIAITGTIPLLHHADIHDCQRRTLETLVGAVSVNGQIPSNVSIATGKPDYSGVGGICSIDSGLWFIIAFHDYVKASRDINFLRTHFATLLRIMDWLSAQDGNNDALLEIPEAGDWTDLFGRSYNVLYDEVLWYRANICFGRLLELLGVREKAGDYLRWSQQVKREILLNFWPTTKNRLYQSA
jgi:sucrose-6-phosphatase